MSRLARALIAATSVATLASATSFAEPTDRLDVDQSNDGSTTASDDITAEQATTVVTSAFAQANSTTGLVTEWTEVTGGQSLLGSSYAISAVRIDDAWYYVTSNASAQGNALSVRGYGDVDLDFTQTAGANARTGALSDLRITNYGAHTVQGASAVMNAVEVASYGERDVTLHQDSAGDTAAIALLDASTAEVETVAQGATAAGNSLKMSGEEFARIDIEQTQSGDVTADTAAVVGLADWGVVSASQAAGNTVTLTNDWGYGEIRGAQTNSGAVQATTNLALGAYTNGVAAGTANAVGNSALTSVIGADAYSGVAQTNTGDVGATVNFIGGAGGGLGTALSASAMGNAQSAYSCSYCPVSLNGAFTQSNSGAVTSQVNAAHAGYVGAITSTSSALGNVATFSTRNND